MTPIALCNITVEHLNKVIQSILTVRQDALTTRVAAVIHHTVDLNDNLLHMIIPFVVILSFTQHTTKRALEKALYI